MSGAAWGLHDCSFFNQNKMPLFCNLRCLKNPDELRDFLSAVVGFPGGSSGKEHARQCRKHVRRRFSPWVGKIPWRRARQLTPVFLLGKSPWMEEPGEEPGLWNDKTSNLTKYSTANFNYVTQCPSCVPVCPSLHWGILKEEWITPLFLCSAKHHMTLRILNFFFPPASYESVTRVSKKRSLENHALSLLC